MRNIFFLTPIFVLMCLLYTGFQPMQAQERPYETVTLNGQRYFKYKVQTGEGLYAISRLFAVPIAEIIRHNPDASSGLKNGQELLIPVNDENSWRVFTPDSTQPVTVELRDQNFAFQHTVSKGETLYSISNMYHTSVDDIIRLNPGAGEGIGVGQILTIPQRRVISEEKEENYRYHTILPKETLYSVARAYSLKPEDVILANPGLSAETFQIGKIIRIPFFESYEIVPPFEFQTKNITHSVQKGETLYSIARNYQVEVAEIERLNPKVTAGLKANMDLVIPVKRSLLERDSRSRENEANRLLMKNMPTNRVDVMRVGLLLPFLDETGKGHLRLQEYYEGFLLAVDELKNSGVNLELFVFEIGQGDDTRKLRSLLETIEMRSLNLVIGGVNDAQIRLLSDFSRSNNIKYVVPFSQSNGEVLNNGNMFQVNPLISVTNTKASAAFVQSFRNANIIFATGGQNDKKEFITELQRLLRENGVRYESIPLSETTNSTILPFLKPGKENVILPTSADSHTLRQLISELKEVRETDSLSVIRLFGYPEWQTFTDQIADYHLFGTYIYTTFFVDKTNPHTATFIRNFNKWYGRNPMDTHPSYSMWGYDTALYFLTALYRFGTRFEQDINRVRISTLQFPFHFERMNNWGGLLNEGLYFIHYDTNGRIYQTDKSL